MSSLGEFRQMSPETLEDIRSEPLRSFERVLEVWENLPVEGDWKRLAALMDLAGFPVNPMTGADAPFPNEHRNWGARVLTPEQVAVVADRLAATPFERLGSHLTQLFEYGWTSRDPDGDVQPLPAGEPGLREAVRGRLAAAWAELTEYFAEAAAEGRQTIFWAG